MPDKISDRMPEDMPDRMPEGMPDKVPECLPDRMPDSMSEDMPEDMPDRVPEDLPEHMPKDMPDRMPDRMPENMSDRMPEDLPVTKCINVMVGITRSKVIELDNIKNETILRDFLQKWKVECSADGLVPMRFAIFPFHHSTCLKYCACHEKVMPGHTQCCTCRAKSC